jgi:spore coat-associated protein N
MRRILFPLLVIGLAAGLFTLGSGAFFSDTETDTGNTITAGTLDLSLTGTGYTSSQCDIAAYQPTASGDVTFDGALATCKIPAKNVGSLDGDLYLRTVVTNVSCVANGGSGEACDSSGDLGSQLHQSLCSRSVNGTSSLGVDANQPCGSGIASDSAHVAANSLAHACAKVASPLKAGDTYTIEFDLADHAVTNASQGDKVTFDFYFELVQVGQSATCP